MKRNLQASLFFALFVLVLSVPANVAFASNQTGMWSPTGSMNVARKFYTSTLLPNGQVLVAGGNNNTNVALASAELYNPATGTWSLTGSMNSPRLNFTSTLLPNGQVLVAGGDDNNNVTLASAELYDPSTGTWSLTSSMTLARQLHTATLLPDGKVLVAGGVGTINYLAEAEIYDPSTGTWSTTSSMNASRYGFTATLLSNGNILVAGGLNSNGPNFTNYLAEAELYDPSTGTWSPTGSMNIARNYHDATLLSNGQILIAGGINNDGILASTELYNPITGTWSLTGSMNSPRALQPSTLLPNGQVLVAGGYDNGSLPSAELYDPTTGTWSITGSMSVARENITATLLSNGNVLITGGDDNDHVALANAELFSLSPVSGPVLISAFPNATIPEGNAYTANGTFTDPGATSWTATVDYGDGSGSQPLTLSGMNFSLSHMYGTQGTYTVTVSITDNQGVTGTGTATVTVNSLPPTITSPATTSTGMRTPFDFTVTTTGSPVATITETGALPSGITFTDNGNGTADLAGTAPAGSAGTYPITIMADNGSGTPTTQNFVLTVTTATSAPAITSNSSDTETFGVPFSFTVDTTGYPAPTLTKTGALPSGVTFTDNGNGTATIAGTPSASAIGVYNVTLKAKSSVGTTTQSFTLTVTKAPVIKSIATKTAHVGTAFSMAVKSSGYTTPTLTESGTLPNGLTFTDNGNGTATLAGTPAVGSGGTYSITVTATNQLGSSSQTFALKVDEAPNITSAASANATQGSPFTFQVTTTGFPAPSLSKSGTLPKGVTFQASARTFSGTPKSGTSGSYLITIIAKNSSGTVTQSFVLTIN